MEPVYKKLKRNLSLATNPHSDKSISEDTARNEYSDNMSYMLNRGDKAKIAKEKAGDVTRYPITSKLDQPGGISLPHDYSKKKKTFSGTVQFRAKGF